MSEKSEKLEETLTAINSELSTISKAVEIIPDLVTAVHANNTLLRELISTLQNGATTPAEPINGAALERIRRAASGQ